MAVRPLYISSVVVPFFFLLLSSCVSTSVRDARVQFDESDKTSFVFFIEHRNRAGHLNVERSELHPQLTKEEARVLDKILRKQGSCSLNNDKIPSFQVISRQEEVYDVTYAGLIEQNYNPRPVAPIMYFGRCIQ